MTIEVAAAAATAVQVGQAVLALTPTIIKAVDLAEKLYPESGSSTKKLESVKGVVKEIVANTDQIKVTFADIETVVTESINFFVFIKNQFHLWGKI